MPAPRISSLNEQFTIGLNAAGKSVQVPVLRMMADVSHDDHVPGRGDMDNEQMH